MFSVPHLVVLFIVVLVFFGPHKLPELARGLGKLMAEFRKASNDFKMAFEEEMRNIERQAREAEWKKSQQEAEAKQKAELASSSGSVEAAEPKILPESSTVSVPTEPVEPSEPVVASVNEAVARESHSSQATEETSAEIPPDEGTPSEASSSPAHDQRQPA